MANSAKDSDSSPPPAYEGGSLDIPNTPEYVEDIEESKLSPQKTKYAVVDPQDDIIPKANPDNSPEDKANDEKLPPVGVFQVVRI